MNRRSQRLEWVAGLSLVLAMAALPAAAATVQNVATETTLNVSTSDRSGRTQATATISVTDESGLPAAGSVSIQDGTRVLAQAPLDASGQASATLNLLGGAHSLRAVYSGDATHMVSTSPLRDLQTESGSTPYYAVSLTPITPSSFPMVLKQGASGTAQVVITPENNSALTAPMFVTLSCSGLPNEASCTFTPETIEILPTTPTSCPAGSPASACPPTSSMVVQTVSSNPVVQSSLGSTPGRRMNTVAWAFLLPGVLGLGGLAWGTRRRSWLSRLALVALLGVVSTIGLSGCSPLYRYYQHGPGSNPATPTGTYNVTITAQSSNGVGAVSNFTTMVLTVQ
jgi:hypothetical protein